MKQGERSLNELTQQEVLFRKTLATLSSYKTERHKTYKS